MKINKDLLGFKNESEIAHNPMQLFYSVFNELPETKLEYADFFNREKLSKIIEKEFKIINKFDNLTLFSSKEWRSGTRTLLTDDGLILVEYFHDESPAYVADREEEEEIKKTLIIGRACITIWCLSDKMDFYKEKLEKIISIKEKDPSRGQNVNLICVENSNYYLKAFKPKINLKKFDVELNYGKSFLPVYERITTKINNSEKGIVLLHGVMGSGKTSLIRYLLDKFPNKKVIYITPDMATQIADPQFITFLLGHPNSVLIIEDAENILRSREEDTHNSAVTNLLNISDGILGDCLNIQIICTFNTELKNIDSALLRDGRLIAEYKFDKLNVEDSNKLIKHLKKNFETKDPMTLAEIYCLDDKAIKNERKQTKTIGFGRN